MQIIESREDYLVGTDEHGFIIKARSPQATKVLNEVATEHNASGGCRHRTGSETLRLPIEQPFEMVRLVEQCGERVAAEQVRTYNTTDGNRNALRFERQKTRDGDVERMKQMPKTTDPARSHPEVLHLRTEVRRHATNRRRWVATTVARASESNAEGTATKTAASSTTAAKYAAEDAIIKAIGNHRTALSS